MKLKVTLKKKNTKLPAKYRARKVAEAVGLEVDDVQADDDVVVVEMSIEPDELEAKKKAIASIDQVESVEVVEDEEIVESKFKMPSVHQFIKEAAEADASQYGEEIKMINDYLKKDHPEHDEFNWDGKKLTITMKDESEVTKTREELTSAIDGFPADSSVKESRLKFLKRK